MYNSAVTMLFSSSTIYIVVTCFVLTLILIANELNRIKLIRKKSLNQSEKFSVVIDANNNGEQLKEAPGPKPKFIVGNLDSLRGYEIPYQAFTDLGEKYGNIVKLQLGSVPAIVVNGVNHMKEVMVTKGHQFDARPNFKRYHMLFDGNKNNSLAFCNWSDLHKVRREMLSPHLMPRKFSMNFNRFGDISMEYLQQLSVDIKHSMEVKKYVSVKPLLNETCANIFTQYFTTRSFEPSDPKFQQLVMNFEKIFWEINQGYAADFLPFLLPFHRNNLKKLQQWSHSIRDFIMSDIVGERYNEWTAGSEPNDYIESLIDHVKQGLEPKMDLHTALFALEDIIGGYAAVTNFVSKVLAFIVKNKEVQTNIQTEVDNLLNERSEKSVLIADRNKLIYTEATIMETLRCVASPLVPHAANQDSSIDGYSVKAGTIIFLNNYGLNMSTDLWDAPEKFEPKRFISNGRILKPDHFYPFGMGRRSCIGYKMVQFLSIAIVGNLLKEFDISSLNGEEVKVPCGSLAMAEDPFHFAFSLRH